MHLLQRESFYISLIFIYAAKLSQCMIYKRNATHTRATALVYLDNKNRFTYITGPISSKLKNVIQQDIKARLDTDGDETNIIVKPFYESTDKVPDNMTDAEMLQHIKSLYQTVYVADLDHRTAKYIKTDMGKGLKVSTFLIDKKSSNKVQKKKYSDIKRLLKMLLFKSNQVIYGIDVDPLFKEAEQFVIPLEDHTEKIKPTKHKRTYYR